MFYFDSCLSNTINVRGWDSNAKRFVRRIYCIEFIFLFISWLWTSSIICFHLKTTHIALNEFSLKLMLVFDLIISTYSVVLIYLVVFLNICRIKAEDSILNHSICIMNMQRWRIYPRTRMILWDHFWKAFEYLERNYTFFQTNPKLHFIIGKIVIDSICLSNWCNINAGLIKLCL